MPDDHASVSDTDGRNSVVIVVPDELAGEPITLRRYWLEDAAAVKESIAASFAELNGWMPWAQSEPTDESSSRL